MSRVVVTGASRGIGIATALVLVRAGHSVAATMRNPADAVDLRRIASDENLAIQVEKLDVESDASVS